MSTTSEIAALLQALVQQQTALLQVHGESLRMQRLLLEHLLGTGEAHAGGVFAELSSAGAQLQREVARLVQAPVTPAAVPSTEPSHQDAPAAEALIGGDVPVDRDPDTLAAGLPQRLQPEGGADGASRLPGTQADGGAAAQASREPPAPGPPGAPTGASSRAARYYQAHPSRPVPQVSRQDLDRLKQLRDIGAAGHLVLQFGPHKGATLAQVARHDPAYVRELALKAQRAEVRVAATELLAILEATDPKPRRRSGSRASRSSP